MTRAEFERLVVEAIMLIPKRFRREMQNLALVVEEEPNAELLAEMEIEPPDSLYGLYQGIPLPERTWSTAMRSPIASRCSSVPSKQTTKPRTRFALPSARPSFTKSATTSGSAKRKSRRSRSGTGGVTRSAPMRTTSEGTEQVQWERVGLDIAVPSPPHISLPCAAHQSECGRTAAARGRHHKEEPSPGRFKGSSQHVLTGVRVAVR